MMAYASKSQNLVSPSKLHAGPMGIDWQNPRGIFPTLWNRRVVRCGSI